jgi:hypothetical protein
MTANLQLAAPVLALVSFVFVCIGIAPSLRKSRIYNFLCGELGLFTAIAYVCLAVLVGGSYPIWCTLWIITSSTKFAHAAFVATE